MINNIDDASTATLVPGLVATQRMDRPIYLHCNGFLGSAQRINMGGDRDFDAEVLLRSGYEVLFIPSFLSGLHLVFVIIIRE